ncbi:hypothetical protein M427DRAFT_132185 [Gonapodya prolifera JEL478]|uniref:Uncharacterized protein n=1 Tax=Gonapodya prolifera (strain JEL478) TaxID=1344416 RepID=A0A139AQX5_GONPJ|nr:hypothetical protein M427DRAFT_132185 [Gonapodya prolifera JEL478]|eukprot:KXS19150.1 hypothetical protein M427DRAFT_132185 [Gonapodya prolifera JEL478]
MASFGSWTSMDRLPPDSFHPTRMDGNIPHDHVSSPAGSNSGSDSSFEAGHNVASNLGATAEHPDSDSDSDAFSSPSSDDGVSYLPPQHRYGAPMSRNSDVPDHLTREWNGAMMLDTMKPAKKIPKDLEPDIYENPDLYGLRRSGRSRANATRYEETTPDDSESEDFRSRKRKDGASRRVAGSGDFRKRRRGDDNEDGDDDDDDMGNGGSDSFEGSSGSDDGYGGRSRRKRGKAKRRVRRSAGVDDEDAIATLDGHLRFSMRARPQKNYNERAMGEDAGLTSSDEDEGKKRKRLTQEEMLTEEGEAVDKILDWKVEKKKTAESGEDNGEEEDDDDEQVTYFLIKWVGRSHLHNTWETLENLRDLKGFQRVKNFIKKKIEVDAAIRADPTVSKEEIEQLDIRLEMEREILEDYKSVDRVISWRQRADGGMEYYCKWRRLDYAECTWESAEAISATCQGAIDAFLNREQSLTVPYRSISHRNIRLQFKVTLEQPSYMVGGTLRDYQLMGVNWAVKLWHQNENGILADEMGLGKTVQTISVLNYLFHDDRIRLYGPFLVVVPLSTIGSWQREFARWAPDINCIVYTGDPLSREIIREYEFCFSSGKAKGKLKFNVLLTTYELVLKDEAVLRGVQWAYLAVDEAHRLKNQESQLHEALSRLSVANRLLITGTPLQNNVQELVSLVKFLMPAKAAELESINVSINDDSDNQQRIREFHKLLTPYMCRRLKKDVEKDLPSKTERILRVELAPLQVKYYRNILTRNYNALVSTSGRPRSLLNIVMELKKTSDHAYLIEGADDTYTALKEDRLRALVTNSGKMVLLDKLLTRLKEDGHRVLIFSQLVMMLNLLSEYMSLRGFAFQRLDGSIPSEARKRAIESFNASNSPDFAFLLSTRAGGLGINLETADTVILFDSDWNPQNDLQAMARAHRIGQTKHVNVYRFISKDTIEEDILERAKRKMVLEFALIKQMEAKGSMAPSKKTSASQTDPDKYSKAELEAILKFGAQNLFKDTENNQAKLDELNLDDILARAEHHETTTGEEDEGMEFMEQWKVQDFGVTQLGWDDIIPEEERKRAQEELRNEEELRRIKQSSETGSRLQKPENAGALAKMYAADAGDGHKRQKARAGSKRGKSGGAVDVLTPTDIRALIRGLMKFGDAPERFDRVLEEGDLASKRRDVVEDNAHNLIAACREAVKIAETTKRSKAEESVEDFEQHPVAGKRGSKMTSIEFGGVNPINAGKLVTRLEDLAVLHARLQKKNLENFRLPVDVKGVQSGWNCPWGIKDDSMLLVGIYKYGYGSWEKMQEDHTLGFESKFFLNDDDDDAKKKPQSIHLERRADTLIRAWKAEIPFDRGEAGERKSSKGKSFKTKLDAVASRNGKSLSSEGTTKKKRPSKAEEESLPGKVPKGRGSDGTKERKEKSRPVQGSFRKLIPDGKRKRLEDTAEGVENRKKRKDSEGNKRVGAAKEDAENAKASSGRTSNAGESTTNKKADNLSPSERSLYKEKMRGVRTQLKEFAVPDHMSSKAKMSYLWPRLREVVIHLEHVVKQSGSDAANLEGGLWDYVASHWVLLNVDGVKMKEFYGKLKKRMEPESTADGATSSHSSITNAGYPTKGEVKVEGKVAQKPEGKGFEQGGHQRKQDTTQLHGDPRIDKKGVATIGDSGAHQEDEKNLERDTLRKADRSGDRHRRSRSRDYSRDRDRRRSRSREHDRPRSRERSRDRFHQREGSPGRKHKDHRWDREGGRDFGEKGDRGREDRRDTDDRRDHEKDLRREDSRGHTGGVREGGHYR